MNNHHISCPVCRAEIVELQPSAVCPSCAVSLHLECARVLDFKCPNCRTELITNSGSIKITVSGENAKDVEFVARSLLEQSKSHETSSEIKDTSSQEKDDKPKVGVNFGNASSFSGKIGNIAGRDIIAKALPSTEDRQALRHWWHTVLRENRRYSCYGIFLVLPSDGEAIKYLNDFGVELDIISGDNCSIIALSNTKIRRSRVDENLWNTALEEHISEGHSLKVARIFNIEMTQFPCLVLFKDIRSPEHVMLNLKGMSVKEIAEKMRLVFSLIQKAIKDQENPLTLIEKQRNQEKFSRAGKMIISQIRSFSGKSFEIATEAWLKSIIK